VTSIRTAVDAACPPFLRIYKARIEASPLGYRLAKGAFWSVVGAVVSRAMGLAASVLLARLLGRTPFGELGTIQSTVGLFGIFAGLGLGITATKYVAELREIEKDRCGRVIGFSLSTAVAGGAVAGLGLVLFGKWLAVHTLAAPHLANALRCGAGLVVFNTVQGAYLGALSGFEAFRQSAWVNFFTGILGAPLVVFGGLLAGVEGAVWGMVLQALVGCILGHIALAKELEGACVRLSFAVDVREWRVLWRFTLPAFLSGMLTTPAGWLSRTLLVNQAGGYADMATVSAANQWMNLMNFVPYMMGGVLVPIFANLHATGRQHEFKRLVRYNIALNAGLSAAIALPLVLCAPLILGFYGPSFRDGVSIFWITMLAGVFISVNNLLSRSMQSAGRAWTDLTSNFMWAASVLVASWFLVHSYKGLGLVVAHTLAALALMAWQWFLVRRLLMTASAQLDTHRHNSHQA
jgi:O-antigen/teichoic acid export membrane protein